MDKKSFIAAIACVVLIFAWQGFVTWQWGSSKSAPEDAEGGDALPAAAAAAATGSEPGDGASFAVPAADPDAAAPSADTAVAAADEGAEAEGGAAPAAAPAAADGLPEVAPPQEFAEERAVLETDLMRMEISNRGGAVARVVLNDPAENDGTPIELDLAPSAMLAMLGVPGAGQAFPYRIESASADRVELVAENGDLRIERGYELVDAEGYGFTSRVRITNLGDSPVGLSAPGVALGTAPSLGRNSKRAGLYLGFDVQPSDSERAKHLHPMKKPKRVDGRFGWAAVKNKYAALIVVPGEDFVVVEGAPLLDPLAPKEGARGMTAEAFFPEITIPAGGHVEYAFDAYAGPKKADRLIALPHGEEQVLEFGRYLSGVCKLLLNTMNMFYRVFRNYGVAIIVLTILIKLIFWPISARSARSMRRMQKLQPLVKELREDFKDDPQRLQQETMKLYKEHKVNPMGGCLPMVVQIPVFWALFKVLRVAIELRGAGFLWVNDLSEPDTVFSIPYLWLGNPLDVNPLAILMGITMVFQQRMTPTSGDPSQARMMMFMPVIFTALFYTFPSGLTLYWTVNQVLTIAQQYWTIREGHDEPPTPKPKSAPGLRGVRRKR